MNALSIIAPSTIQLNQEKNQDHRASAACFSFFHPTLDPDRMVHQTVSLKLPDQSQAQVAPGGSRLTPCPAEGDHQIAGGRLIPEKRDVGRA